MDTQNSLNTTTANQDSSLQKNDLIKSLLKQYVLDILFTKVDGTERKMKCTLRTDLLPPQESITESVEHNQVCRVYDLDNNGWRSFRFDNLLAVDVVTA